MVQMTEKDILPACAQEIWGGKDSKKDGISFIF